MFSATKSSAPPSARKSSATKPSAATT